MRIRDYKTQDFEEIAVLWKETGVGNPARGDSRKTIMKTLQVGGKFFILEDDQNNVVGTSWITDDGRRLYLHHLAIRPYLQEKGLGRRLMEKSIEFAKEKKMQIKLEVHAENFRAVKMYKNLGFKILENYGTYILRETERGGVDV